MTTLDRSAVPASIASAERMAAEYERLYKECLASLRLTIDERDAALVAAGNMRLRDDLAMAAMQGILSSGRTTLDFQSQPTKARDIACAAYLLADAMLSAKGDA